MKALKFLAITVLILLAAVSFFLPYKSYYPWFIFTSDHLVFERVADNFFSWSIGAKLCFLVIFAPAMALAVLQTRLEKNLTTLLIASLISSAMLFSADFGLCFGIFEVQIKFLFDYFLFIGLSVSGCIIFWIMTLREIWHRIRNRRQKLKVA
jgi:hypothetical protein